jgi:hypothetical protein
VGEGRTRKASPYSGQTLSENYTRLHPRRGTTRGNWCSRKSKNPGFSGVFVYFCCERATS